MEWPQPGKYHIVQIIPAQPGILVDYKSHDRHTIGGSEIVLCWALVERREFAHIPNGDRRVIGMVSNSSGFLVPADEWDFYYLKGFEPDTYYKDSDV